MTDQYGCFNPIEASDLVPPGYWDRLIEAMRNASTLPERPFFPDPDMATGHGDTIESLLGEIDRHVRECARKGRQ